MSDAFNTDPDKDYQDTLDALERHKNTLKRIEDAYTENQYIASQDLDWLFRITHANFRMIQSSERLICAMRKNHSALQLDIVLKDQEIHELRNQ